MNSDDFGLLEEALPSAKESLVRMRRLIDVSTPPRIAAFGNYNHGKSTLLNAIIKTDRFKTADKRQTTDNEEHESDGVIWVDTPGLNADIKREDDEKAMSAAFEIADYLMIVHNAKAGELDKAELNLYQRLMRQDKNYKAKMILVLTHMEQLTEDELKAVRANIRKQLPDLLLFSVSSTRFLKGVKENKAQLAANSGIPQLLDHVHSLKMKVKEKRRNELSRLKQKIMVDMDERKRHLTGEISQLSDDLEQRVARLRLELKRIFTNAHSLLEE